VKNPHATAKSTSVIARLNTPEAQVYSPEKMDVPSYQAPANTSACKRPGVFEKTALPEALRGVAVGAFGL
jgi:hypothetical protein